MKRYNFLAVFIAIALCVICFVLFPTDAKAASVDDLTFTLNSNGDSYTVSDCNEDASGALEIPATYNDMPVNTIGEDAFANCTKLTSIIIPDSVTDIYGGAFSGCSSLESMTIPLSDSYPFGIFFGTENYTGGVATEQIFNDYDPEDPGTFFETCYIPASLKSVTVTNCVIKDAFYNCSNLTTIILSDKVSTISDLAFYNCKNLTEIQVSENNKSFYSDSKGVLYNASKTRLIFASKTLGDSYTIPSSVTSIDAGAFSGCNSLKSLTTPLVGFTTKKVTHYPYHDEEYNYHPFGYIFGTTYFNGSIEIQQMASSYSSLDMIECEYYRKYYFPASLTSVTVTGDIANYAFSGCSNITDIVISDKAAYIGEGAFYKCDANVYYGGTDHFEGEGSTAPTTEPAGDPTTAPTVVPTDPTSATSKPTKAPTKPTKAPTTATTKPTQKPTTAPNHPTTTATEPSMQPSQPVTQSTEQPSTPDIEENGATTAPSLQPTDPVADTPSESNNNSGSIPWWWLLIVGIVCIGGGAAVAIIILKKKK